MEDPKNTIDNYIVQDKIVRINSNELENANRIQVSSTVSTNKNGVLSNLQLLVRLILI